MAILQIQNRKLTIIWLSIKVSTLQNLWTWMYGSMNTQIHIHKCLYIYSSLVKIAEWHFLPFVYQLFSEIFLSLVTETYSEILIKRHWRASDLLYWLQIMTTFYRSMLRQLQYKASIHLTNSSICGMAVNYRSFNIRGNYHDSVLSTFLTTLEDSIIEIYTDDCSWFSEDSF